MYTWEDFSGVSAELLVTFYAGLITLRINSVRIDSGVSIF
jgi:hypothetical protein